MAARSTTKAGDWSDPEVWSSGVVPGAGDTVTINHAVTVTGARTVGHSPGAGDATAAILVNGTGGSLTISGPDAYLTVRGDLRLNTAVLTCTGSGVLEFDATQAATPSTARYVLQVGTANNQGTARLVFTGADNANRFTIRSKSGGANARVTGPTSGGTRHTIQFCNLLRIGDASNNSFTCHGGSLGGGASYTIADSTFERCGVYDLTLSATAGTWTLDRVEFRDGVHTNTDVDFSLPSTKTGGARRIKQCSFGKKCTTISYSTGLEFEDNYGGPDSFSIIQSGSTWSSCQGNLIQWRSAGTTIAVNGTYSSNYCFQNALTSWHGPSLVKPVTLSNNVFDSLSADFGEADMITGNSAATAGTYAVRNNLFLPNLFGQALGVGVSMLGNGNMSLVVEHNTFIGDTISGSIRGGVLRVGETYAGKTGLVASVRSNLCYGFGADGRKVAIFYSISSRAITGASRAAECVITSSGHGLTTGSKVRIQGVLGMTELNGNVYTITNLTANTFKLDGIDSTGFGTYASDGEIAVVDAVLPENCSHNGGYNLHDGMGGPSRPGYAHQFGNWPFSGLTFGANDVVADPRFADASASGWRCLATFDTDYLGNAAGPAWSSSSSYAVGDIVSRTVSAIWGGETINYRCIAAHDASVSSRQPGTGSAWISYWELASEYRLRTSVATTTYAEGTPQATVRDLLEWVKDGWRPTNVAYRDAGHDGVTIGALEAVTPPPTRTGPPRFLFRRRRVASVPRFGR